MIIPSITMCGLNISRSRSLQVPGSPSSELQTRYFGAGELARHEAPLQPGRKAGAAAAAQARCLDLGDHLLRRHADAFALRQDLAQRLVAAARLVVLEAPVRAVEAGVDLRLDVAAMEAGLLAGGLEAGEVEGRFMPGPPPSAQQGRTSSSSRSSVMKLTICRSLTSSTGASAQAPRHSDFCTVKAPSARGAALLDAERGAEVLERMLAAAQLARQVGADVQLDPADRRLVEHVVEGRDLVHRDRRHAERLGDELLAFLRDAAVLLLQDRQAGDHGRGLALGRVLGDLALERLAAAPRARRRRRRRSPARPVPRRRR